MAGCGIDVSTVEDIVYYRDRGVTNNSSDIRIRTMGCYVTGIISLVTTELGFSADTANRCLPSYIPFIRTALY